MKLRNIFGWFVVALVGYFFARAIARNWEQVSEINFSVTPGAILATLLFTLAVIVSGYFWGRVFYLATNKKVKTREAIRAYVAAWLLKYVPGQVGAYIYKLQWGQKQGASKTAATVAFAYEMLLLTLASTVVIIPLLLVTTADTAGLSLVTIYIFTLLVVLAASRKSLHRYLKLFIQKITGRKIGEVYVLSLRELTAYTGWFSIARIINAVGFVVLASSILTVTPGMYVPLGAAYILAGIIGIYAFFVPSGLGVREAVIVAFASIYFTTEEAIVLSLLARLYATVADGLVGLLYAYLTKQSKPDKPVKAEIV